MNSNLVKKLKDYFRFQTVLDALFILIIVPAIIIASTTLSLTLNSSSNGYTAKTSSSGTDVECQNVHDGTNRTAKLLEGNYEVTVTFDDKSSTTKTITFKSGNADFGFVDRSKTVKGVKVKIP
ncbi:MAG: hypothetical protein WAQ98_13065 [Blastocatellia bacterium]